jgi:hypothetical protein
LPTWGTPVLGDTPKSKLLRGVPVAWRFSTEGHDHWEFTKKKLEDFAAKTGATI